MKTLAALLVIAFAAPAQAAGTLSAIAARHQLRVGMTPGFVPFVAVGAECEELGRLLGERAPPVRHAIDGRALCGFDVELAVDAARALDVTATIVLVDRFEDLLQRLEAGDFDVVISAVTRTLPRAARVAFASPYFASGIEVRVRDAARFVSLDSLRKPDVKIAFVAGTTAEEMARRELATTTLQALPNQDALEKAMNDPTGCDAVIVDPVSARDAVVRGRVKVEWPRVEDKRFSSERFAFAARQGDPDWLGWLNLFLSEERTSGAFHRLAARFNPWFRMER